MHLPLFARWLAVDPAACCLVALSSGQSIGTHIMRLRTITIVLQTRCLTTIVQSPSQDPGSVPSRTGGCMKRNGMAAASHEGTIRAQRSLRVGLDTAPPATTLSSQSLSLARALNLCRSRLQCLAMSWRFASRLACLPGCLCVLPRETSPGAESAAQCCARERFGNGLSHQPLVIAPLSTGMLPTRDSSLV